MRSMREPSTKVSPTAMELLILVDKCFVYGIKISLNLCHVDVIETGILQSKSSPTLVDIRAACFPSTIPLRALCPYSNGRNDSRVSKVENAFSYMT